MFVFAMPLLIAANATLVTDKMTDAQRIKALRPHISPAPGEMLQLSDYEIRDRKSQDGMKLRGFIHFNPPKGTCFTITRWRDQEDDVVCKAKELSFSMKDLDAGGRLRWRISTGPKDFGQEYVWNSPYRVAQILKAGDDQSLESTDLAVMSCKAEVNADHNLVTLAMHGNRRWKIRFPQEGIKKIPVPVEEPPPDPKAKKPADEKEEKKIATKKAPDRWQLDRTKAFWMSATNFRASSTPPGINGDCYYEFKGAAGDPDSGWIECHNVDLYDVIFVRLPCTKDLPSI